MWNVERAEAAIRDKNSAQPRGVQALEMGLDAPSRGTARARSGSAHKTSHTYKRDNDTTLSIFSISINIAATVGQTVRRSIAERSSYSVTF
jgi:hypothetical protein